jgi:hypothetical protein
VALFAPRLEAQTVVDPHLGPIPVDSKPEPTFFWCCGRCGQLREDDLSFFERPNVFDPAGELQGGKVEPGSLVTTGGPCGWCAGAELIHPYDADQLFDLSSRHIKDTIVFDAKELNVYGLFRWNGKLHKISTNVPARSLRFDHGLVVRTA